MGIFQYLWLYAWPEPGSTNASTIAFRGECCTSGLTGDTVIFAAVVSWALSLPAGSTRKIAVSIKTKQSPQTLLIKDIGLCSCDLIVFLDVFITAVIQFLTLK